MNSKLGEQWTSNAQVEWTRVTHKSHCLLGNPTCPFLTFWASTRTNGCSSTLRSTDPLPRSRNPTSHVSRKEKRWPSPRRLNSPTWYPVKLLPSGQQTKEAAFKPFVREVQTREEEATLQTPSVPLLKFPFDQRAHLSTGASNYFKESSVLMNILGPWAKASHGLALLCWLFDQTSFNLLSWVWFSFCTLSSGPPLCWLFFEVSGRLVGRRAIGNRRTTGCSCFYIFALCFELLSLST